MDVEAELNIYKEILDGYFKGPHVVSGAEVPYAIMTSYLTEEIPQAREQVIANARAFGRAAHKIEKDYCERFWAQLKTDFRALLEILKSADPEFPVEEVYEHFCMYVDDRLTIWQ